MSRPTVSIRGMRALSCLAVTLALTGCAVSVAGTPTPEPLRTVDSEALARDVRAMLAADPETAGVAATATITCPRGVPLAHGVTKVTLFCQATGTGRVLLVPVSILDLEGDYHIGRPY